MPKVRVRFSQLTEYEAEVDFDDLTKAIEEDVKEETGEFKFVPSLAAIKGGWVAYCNGKEAGEALCLLIEAAGRETDAYFSVVESVDLVEEQS